jgi:hypothetical protein
MKIPAAILSFIMVQALFYLFGAFVANSFDLSHWNTDGRFAAVMFGSICGVAMFVITYNEMKEAK